MHSRSLLLSPYILQDRWHDTWGHCQVIVHVPSGAWWPLPKTYDKEGYVRILNIHIACGRFDPTLQQHLPPLNMPKW
jgi:hypothetical protein